MKKTLVMIAVVTVVVTVGIGAYAHYEDANRGLGMRGAQAGMFGPRGGGMMNGQRGGKGGYGPSMMRGRGQGGRWNAQANGCPYVATSGTQNAPTRQAQMVSEETVKEAAENYITQYLSGYKIDKVEKDSWRPLFFVTVKGANDAVQTMVVHGFSGDVVNVFPQAASK